jgi:hypothetical protein
MLSLQKQSGFVFNVKKVVMIFSKVLAILVLFVFTLMLARVSLAAASWLFLAELIGLLAINKT